MFAMNALFLGSHKLVDKLKLQVSSQTVERQALHTGFKEKCSKGSYSQAGVVTMFFVTLSSSTVKVQQQRICAQSMNV